MWQSNVTVISAVAGSTSMAPTGGEVAITCGTAPRSAWPLWVALFPEPSDETPYQFSTCQGLISFICLAVPKYTPPKPLPSGTE